jgi:hypothetical protein
MNAARKGGFFVVRLLANNGTEEQCFHRYIF